MKIIKVGALWCPACLITNNALKKIKEEYPDIIIEELDYDYDEDKVKEYNVGTILPELIFISDDKEINRLIGEKSYKEIKKVIGRD
jgi:thiol-disulfide isomerase/thioredoxin